MMTFVEVVIDVFYILYNKVITSSVFKRSPSLNISNSKTVEPSAH